MYECLYDETVVESQSRRNELSKKKIKKKKKKHGDLRRIEFYPNRMGVNDTSIVSNGICA